MIDPMPLDRSSWCEQFGRKSLRTMMLIRELETRLEDYAKRGLIRGTTHPSVGMEAVAVGVTLHLTPADKITSTHRGHGHCLAKGAHPGRLVAELFGRSTGYSKGKGGSMHVAARDLGILGTNGVVGASIGLATGAALAARLQRSQDVAVAFFGDGAINQGIFHEALNLASIWNLPCVYVCENNHYAQSSAVEEMSSIRDLSARAQGYGIPGLSVDGMDVYRVWEASHMAVSRARSGKGPTLIVADTYRFLGHHVGDTEIYRTAGERDSWKTRDPILRLERELLAGGLLTEDSLGEIRLDVARVIDDAEAAAVVDPMPVAEAAYADVYGSS